MKVSEILGQFPGLNPRGEIEFDQDQRDQYVARFLAAFDADVDEDNKARLVHAIHMEIRAQHDLYIAVADKLGYRLKQALHVYVRRYGSLVD